MTHSITTLKIITLNAKYRIVSLTIKPNMLIVIMLSVVAPRYFPCSQNRKFEFPLCVRDIQHIKYISFTKIIISKFLKVLPVIN